jgi:NADPH:quinone reductase-like Zn-dependent oxidoreductase
MKAAVVSGAGQTPVYGEFQEPVSGPEDYRIAVRAAAISQLARGRASGGHYSASGRFPLVAGVDGVGRLDDGRRVYFVLPEAPYGSMAEIAAVPASRCLPLPDALDDVTAAAIANPGMSSWIALKERAHLKAGETVLINGATGISGRLGVQIAKYLGAGKVIATGRNNQSLEQLKSLGADETISLVENENSLEERFGAAFTRGVDVVLDYLWGESARQLLIAVAKNSADGVPMRFVQVGSMSGDEIALPAKVLRASAIELIGSGFGSVPLDRLVNGIGELLLAAVPAGLEIAVSQIPLSHVEEAWADTSSATRTVLTIGEVRR